MKPPPSISIKEHTVNVAHKAYWEAALAALTGVLTHYRPLSDDDSAKRAMTLAMIANDADEIAWQLLKKLAPRRRELYELYDSTHETQSKENDDD